MSEAKCIDCKSKAKCYGAWDGMVCGLCLAIRLRSKSDTTTDENQSELTTLRSENEKLKAALEEIRCVSYYKHVRDSKHIPPHVYSVARGALRGIERSPLWPNPGVYLYDIDLEAVISVVKQCKCMCDNPGAGPEFCIHCDVLVNTFGRPCNGT